MKHILFSLLVLCLCCQTNPAEAQQSWAIAKRFSKQNFGDWVKNTAAAIAPDGSTYLCGNASGPVDGLPMTPPAGATLFGWLAKFDTALNVVWAHAFSQYTYDLTTDAAGNVFVAGSVLINGDDGQAFVAKYAPDGQQLASFSAGGDGRSWAKVVKTDAQGKVFIGGERFSAGTVTLGAHSFPPTNSRQCFLASFDNFLSQTHWATYTGLSSNLDNLYDIELDGNGGLYAAGNYSQNYSFGCFCYNGDFFVEKHNPETGASLWKQVFSGGSGSETKQHLALGQGGEIYVTGSFKNGVNIAGINLPGAGTDDYLVFGAALNATSGLPQWVKLISESGDAYPERLVWHQDALIVSGSYKSPAAFGDTILTQLGDDAFLVAFSPADGTVLGAERASGQGDDAGSGLAARDSILVWSGNALNSATLGLGSFSLTGDVSSFFVAKNLGALSPPPPAADFNIVAGIVEGAQGDTLLLPVFITGCLNPTSLQGQLNLETPGVAQVLGILNAALAPVTAHSDNSVAFNAFGNTSITDSTVLFYVQVALTGAPGDSSVVNFGNSTFQTLEASCNGEVLPIGIVTGTIKIKDKLRLSLLASTCDGQPVKDADASVIILHNNTESTRFGTTDASGTCVIENIPTGSQATIVMEKDTNPMNGLASAFCLYQFQQFLLGNPSSGIGSPCQVVAADYNGNGVASTYDLYLIAQAAVNGTGLPAPHKSWVFVPKTHVWPNPFTAQNVFPFPQAYPFASLKTDTLAEFWAIKIGSICMTADPQKAAPAPVESRNEQEFDVVAKAVAEPSTNRLRVRFSPSGDFNLASFQCEMAFDAVKLKLLEVEAAEIEPLWGNTGESVRLMWFDLQGVGALVSPGTPMFEFVFETSGAFSLSDQVSNLLWIKEGDFPAAVYNTDEAPHSILFIGEQSVSSQQNLSGEGPLTFTAAPNPASTVLHLGFQLQQPETLRLVLTNALGQLALSKEIALNTGAQALDLDVSKLPGGAYVLSLEAGTFRKTMSILVAH